jgi:tetratricopeptide (TPR) repeat protein
MTQNGNPDWGEVEDLFHGALERPASAREKWLHAQTSDRAVRNEVESLLAGLRRHEELSSEPAAAARVAGQRVAGQDGELRLPGPFGSFQPVRLIGRGGMGTVYLGRRVDGQFEQNAAIKVMAAHLLGTDPGGADFVRRFHTERQLLASLNHPHITRLLDGGVSPAGDPYLVMEYVQGEQLDRYCDSRKLSIEGRLRLFLQVCEAVDYAHRSLIVHRDLKPNNILVTADGQTKLLDFGTAALMAEDSKTTVTRTRMVTPRYASPERLRGERVNTANDVFSLGVILYELLTGAWPFGSPDSLLSELKRALGEASAVLPQNAITKQAAETRAATSDQLRRALKGDLSAILMKALATRPDDRYSSARDFADDIRRYLSGSAVVARGDTFAYRGAKFVSRYRWRIATGALAAAALLFAIFYGSFQYGRDQRRLAQIRELSQSYLTDVYGEVSRLPGSTRARMLLVDRTRKSLDELLSDTPRDPELRRAAAKAYIQLGAIQGEPFAISAGDSAGALISYRKGEAIAGPAGNRDWETNAILVRARTGIAEIQVRAGNYHDAEVTLRAELETARRIWQDGPPNLLIADRSPAYVYVRINLLLGHALMRAADVQHDAEGVKQALSQFQRTIAIAEQVRRRDPGGPDLAGRYSQYVGYAYELLGDYAGDIEYYRLARIAHQRAADSARTAYAAFPSPAAQRDLADGLGDLGWVERLCGDYDTGVETLKEALAAIEPVSKTDPGSLELQLELATIYERLGAAEGAAGRMPSALEDLTRARSMVKLPNQVEASDRETVVLFTRIREHLARIMIHRHRNQEAVALLTEAVSAVEGGSSVPGWRALELEHELEEARALANGEKIGRTLGREGIVPH